MSHPKEVIHLEAKEPERLIKGLGGLLYASVLLQRVRSLPRETTDVWPWNDRLYRAKDPMTGDDWRLRGLHRRSSSPRGYSSMAVLGHRLGDGRDATLYGRRIGEGPNDTRPIKEVDFLDDASALCWRQRPGGKLALVKAGSSLEYRKEVDIVLVHDVGLDVEEAEESVLAVARILRETGPGSGRLPRPDFPVIPAPIGPARW